MAQVTFSATSKKLAQGLAVESESRGFKLIMDEPKNLGGTDTGMNPVEGLLCALGSCQVIVAAAFAQANGISFSEFWIELEGDLDTDGFLKGVPGVRNGFSEIRTKMHIKTDASADQVEAFAKFIEGRCPVGDTIIAGTVVKNSIVTEK